MKSFECFALDKVYYGVLLLCKTKIYYINETLKKTLKIQAGEWLHHNVDLLGLEGPCQNSFSHFIENYVPLTQNEETTVKHCKTNVYFKVSLIFIL